MLSNAQRKANAPQARRSAPSHKDCGTLRSGCLIDDITARDHKLRSEGDLAPDSAGICPSCAICPLQAYALPGSFCCWAVPRGPLRTLPACCLLSRCTVPLDSTHLVEHRSGLLGKLGPLGRSGQIVARFEQAVGDCDLASDPVVLRAPPDPGRYAAAASVDSGLYVEGVVAPFGLARGVSGAAPRHLGPSLRRPGALLPHPAADRHLRAGPGLSDQHAHHARSRPWPPRQPVGVGSPPRRVELREQRGASVPPLPAKAGGDP